MGEKIGKILKKMMPQKQTSEMSEAKVCPLLSISEEKLISCLEENCEWYDETEFRCGIVTIARNIEALEV